MKTLTKLSIGIGRPRELQEKYSTWLLLATFLVGGCAGAANQQNAPVSRVPMPKSYDVTARASISPAIGEILPLRISTPIDQRYVLWYDANRVIAVTGDGKRIAPLSALEAAQRAGGPVRLFNALEHTRATQRMVGMGITGTFLSVFTLGGFGPSLLIRAGREAFSPEARLEEMTLNEPAVPTWSPSPIEEGFILMRQTSPGVVQIYAGAESERYLFFPVNDYKRLEIPVADTVANETVVVTIPWTEITTSQSSDSL